MILSTRDLLLPEGGEAGVAACLAVAPDGLPDVEAAAEAVADAPLREELLLPEGDLDFRRV